MKIAVISDTHRFEKYMKMAKEHIKDSQILIHLGDNAEDIKYFTKDFNGEFYAVKGNCDYGNEYNKEIILNKCGINILITHGDLYGVKSDVTNLYYKALEVNASIALFGHTHMKYLEEYNGITLINPGSIGLPRLGGRNIAFIEIEEKTRPKIYFKNIVE